MTEPLIETRNLTAGYRNSKETVALLREASLTLVPGSITCLLGPNGAGKSTLLRTLSGMQEPPEGSVLLGGKSIDSMTARDVAERMSVVYTERTGAGALTVGETVALGRQPFTGFFGRLSAGDREIVARSLEDVGMSDFTHRYLGTLSDGERQKVMIARALAQQTPLMLLDEPTSFLDVASRLEVMQLLARLANEQHKAILLSTHDIADALSVASHLWLIMPEGKIAAGEKQNVIDSGAMDRLFANRGIHFDRQICDYRIKESN